MNNKAYYIREYGIIRNAEDFDGRESSPDELYLPAKAFTSLYNYILSNQPPEGDLPFTLFSKGKKLQVKVRNYVGILETPDGVSLEILPKIYTSRNADIQFTRHVFLKMLKTLKNSPFISLNTANLFTKKNFPVLEVFIRSFIEEAERVFTQGVKANYIIKDENIRYLKGKILISQNIKYNAYNHSKFYCEFSEFSEDIAQNRLIKSTLLKLLKLTHNYSNYAQLNKLLTHFENVKPSFSYARDLQFSCIRNKLFNSYNQLIQWSEIFLLNKGFTNFSGDSLNTAILFPMEKIFESYIAYLFKKYTSADKIKTQDRSYFLVEKHKNHGKFRLKPDLYIEKSELDRIVIDTKWKMINESKFLQNYNVNIADMYQLYAYGRKYSNASSIPKLAIIYPKNENFSEKLENFTYENNLVLNIYAFDFNNKEEDEIQKIHNDLKCG